MPMTLRLPANSKAIERIPPEFRAAIAKPVEPIPVKPIVQSDKPRATQPAQPGKPTAAQEIEHRLAVLQRYETCRTDLAILAERFPACFTFDAPVPLAIGIDKQVRVALPDLTSNQASFMLHCWVTRTAYLTAVANGGARYNLDGSEAGPVSDVDKLHAGERLAPRTMPSWRDRKAVRRKPAKVNS